MKKKEEEQSAKLIRCGMGLVLGGVAALAVCFVFLLVASAAISGGLAGEELMYQLTIVGCVLGAFAGGLLDTLGFRGYNAAPFVMEGGAVHSDGEGTLLVTEACLLSAGRNPQLTKDEIAAALCRMLGAKKVLWLPRGIDGDETNEHIDNVCAFVRPGEVVLAYACSQACLHYLEGETDAQGRRIRVHKLPIPRVPVLVTQEDLEGYTFEDGEDVREVGERLAASYVNYYCANGAIVLPAFGGENAASDAQAAAILAGLYPERRIISVYAREILTGGGNIHCITQQIPEGAKL